MRFYVDIDGTITDTQRSRSWFKCPHRLDVIKKVRAVHDAGHEIILWSGNTKYAREVAGFLERDHGIKVVAAVGKPDVIIDNEYGRFSRRLRRRLCTPEAFVVASYEGIKPCQKA